MTARIDLSALVTGSELHAGRRARVVRLAQPRDVYGGALVFKHYLPEYTPQVNAAALDALGDLPVRAGSDAVWLRERTAWPQTLVAEGPDVVGFLMREIPDDFAFSRLSGSGIARILAEVTFLLNEDRVLQDLGLLISDRDRLWLLTDVVDALSRLHALGVCVGDLSPGNLLFAPATHRIFFLGCDSMSPAGAAVLPPVQTPGWELPEGEEPGTRAADVYKVGLLATRMIARNPAERDPSRLGHISARLAALASATLNEAPQSRPTLADWITELKTAAQSASPAPAEVTVGVPIPQITAPATPAAPAPAANAELPTADAPAPPVNVSSPIPPSAAPLFTAPPAPPLSPGPAAAMPLYSPDLPVTVRAEDIVGTPGMPPVPAAPEPPRRRLTPLLVAGTVVVVAGAAAGAAAATGMFTSSSGTVASTTISGSGSRSGLLGSTVPNPSTTTSQASPTPADSSTTTDTPTNSPTPTSPGTSTTTPTPTPTPPPPPPPTSVVGAVQIDPALVTDARAVQVATLFDTYFSAVNAKNFDAALALYDPTGVVKTNDPQQRAAFKKSAATSTDDQGKLKSLSPAGPGPVNTVQISFRSQQAAGYGPADDPSQTCSIWTLTYTLTYTDNKYLIKSATGSHTGC